MRAAFSTPQQALVIASAVRLATSKALDLADNYKALKHRERTSNGF
jgi:hypothetical protein